MIYVKLRSVNVPATMTKKVRHFAMGLVDYLIKIHEKKEISRLEFLCKRWSQIQRKVICNIGMDI